VVSGSYCLRNFFLASRRKAKGMRRPREDWATTRNVRGAPEEGSVESEVSGAVEGESAM
jgi:hypothetical protein